MNFKNQVTFLENQAACFNRILISRCIYKQVVAKLSQNLILAVEARSSFLNSKLLSWVVGGWVVDGRFNSAVRLSLSQPSWLAWAELGNNHGHLKLAEILSKLIVELGLCIAVFDCKICFPNQMSILPILYALHVLTSFLGQTFPGRSVWRTNCSR